MAVKRAYVVGDPDPWPEALAAKARALRVGDPAGGEVDVGPMISEAARDRFHADGRAAVGAGAQVLAGGRPIDGPGWFYPPTVLLADTPEAESTLAGCFGPVVLVRGVARRRRRRRGRQRRPVRPVGERLGPRPPPGPRWPLRLEAGMVAVNEAVTPSAHASAPFGGCKSSGFGRIRGVSASASWPSPG